MELQPLTSISGKTDNSVVVGSKGTLCRMQKVLSEDVAAHDEHHNPPSERRISAGFPLLNKLKTLTDKHHQHQHSSHSAQVQDTFDVGEPSKDESESEQIGTGLPLIQRVLLLKQKEEAESAKSSLAAVRKQPSFSSVAPAQPARKPKAPKKQVEFAEVIPKLVEEREPSVSSTSSKHEKKSEFMKPWCLLRKATINQNYKNSQASGRGYKFEPFRYQYSKSDKLSRDASSTEVNMHRSLTRLYGNGTKNAQSSSAQSSQTCDNTLIKFNTTCDSFHVTEVDEGNENGDNSYKSGSRCGNSNHSNSSSDTESRQTYSSHNSNQFACTVNGVGVVSAESVKSSIRPGGLGEDKSKLCLSLSERSNDSKKYSSVDDLSPEYAGLPFVKKLKILNERQKLAELEENVFIRSCSLDLNKINPRKPRGKSVATNLTRSLSEATAMEVVLRSKRYRYENDRSYEGGNACSLPATFVEGELPSPESCETLERRKLKRILKKISSGNCKITDILRHPELLESSNTENIALSEVELIKKLMNAQTVQGYVARHSTLEKSATYNTVVSPPSTARTVKSSDSSAFTFDDVPLIPITVSPADSKDMQDNANEREYVGKDNSQSPLKNPDLIPDVYVLKDNVLSSSKLPAFVSEHFPNSGYGDMGGHYSQFPCSSYSRDTSVSAQ